MMTGGPSLIRRVYDSVALFCVLNVLGVIALLGYFAATGTLNQERVRNATLALRGLSVTPKTVAPAPGETASAAAPAKPLQAETDEDIEIAYREAERIKAELQQRLALSNSILLKVQQEREAFQKEQAESRRQREAVAEAQRQEGFQRQVAILQALSPKSAVQHLLSVGDIDDAARLLTAMDTTRAKKIIEAAKGPAETAQMKSIVQRVREVVPAQVADAGEK